MIVSLKRWRPLSWPRLASRNIARQQSTGTPKEKGESLVEKFDHMPVLYAEMIFRANKL